jgi:hypothetical protein
MEPAETIRAVSLKPRHPHMAARIITTRLQQQGTRTVHPADQDMQRDAFILSGLADRNTITHPRTFPLATDEPLPA